MNTIEKLDVPFDAIVDKLTKDDDPQLWKTALSVLAIEFLQRHESTNEDWVCVVGACSHWLRPNQWRWTAAGGFAYPYGYKYFKPELDWSVIFAIQDRRWAPVQKLPRKKRIVCQVAIPARTARHKHAVVHTRWTPGTDTIFNGFRNVDGRWKCVAASDEKLRGHI